MTFNRREIWDMSRWSVSRRIKTIVFAVLGALVLTGGFGVFASLRLSGLLTRFYEKAEAVTVANELDETLLEIRLAEALYRSNPDESVAAGVLQGLGDVSATMDRFGTIQAGELALAPTWNDLIAALDAYSEGFSHVVEIERERQEIEAALQEEGPAFFRELGSLDDFLIFEKSPAIGPALKEAKEEFLNLRIYAERYLVSGSAEDLRLALEHRRLVEAAIRTVRNSASIDMVIEAADNVALGLEAFSERIDRVALLVERRTAEYANLEAVGTAVLDGIKTVLGNVSAEQRELQVSSTRTTSLVLISLGILCVASLAGGGGFSHVVARRTEGEIRDAVRQMRALADGDLDLPITGADADHELGEMARALTIFRDNAVAAREMEEQQRIQEAAARQREADEAERRKIEEREAAERVEQARRKVMKALVESVGAVVEAGARGDFSRRIESVFEEPELAEMAKSINRLVGDVEAGIAEVVRVMDRLAAGDLADRMEGDFKGAFAALQTNVNASFERLGGLVAEISGQCEDVTRAASGMADQASELARRAVEQAASLEETAAAMEEVSGLARSSAEGASKAAEVARGASGQVDAAGEVVAAAVQAMSDISAASARINDIVSVIEGIAFQTNLLALNASVEAARAGPAGKGFAVVATEVRALAQRAGAASKDIGTLIDESAAQVTRGVSLVEETGRTLQAIMSGVSEMSEAMQGLTESARSQASGIDEVTRAIGQLDVITQKNAALADRSRSVAADVGSRTGDMNLLLGEFRTAPGAGVAIAAE